MKLFGGSSTSVALIDVRTSSIAAGFVILAKGKAPDLCYFTRLPLEPHATEPYEEAFARTLSAVMAALVKEGGPKLRAASGSGKTDQALVSFSAPWQHSHVFSQRIEPGKPFLFTRGTLADVVRNAPLISEGWTRINEMIIATLLNGYEVDNPFGKRVNRAELLMLSTSVETAMIERLTATVRRALHQHRIDFVAFTPVTYDIFRDLYPQQRDYLALDISAYATDILLVKHGFLVSSTSASHGAAHLTAGASSADAERVWLSHMSATLSEIAKQEPLPRTVFLLAENAMRDELKRLMDAPVLRELWLSDEPIAVLPVVPGQLAPFLAKESAPEGDAPLSILALAAEKRYA